MLIGFILALVFAPSVLPFLMGIVAVGAHAYWVTRLVYRLFSHDPIRT
jgi:cytochrome c biogenesis protein CcdA